MPTAPHQHSQQSTHDLRKHATDQNRDLEHKHKWSPKWAGIQSSPKVKFAGSTGKPPRLVTMKVRQGQRNEREIWIRKKAHDERKKDPLNGTAADSSTDDDELSSQASDGPELEYEGEGMVPAHGQEVLGLALTQAVERYEHHSLLKLVKDEYEVLDGFDEEGHGVKVAVGDFDDEYELV